MKFPLTGQKYIVFLLDLEKFKPFTKTRGPISFTPITFNNCRDVKKNFPPGKVNVFIKKLEFGCVGVFARHKNDVIGYMWRKDYDTKKILKADGYIPLSGKFSHLHFARVTKKMRGRALQLIMFTWLIKDAYKKGYKTIYTDGEPENIVAILGTIKIGFKEVFRLYVIRSIFGHAFSIKYKVFERNAYNSLEKLKRQIRVNRIKKG